MIHQLITAGLVRFVYMAIASVYLGAGWGLVYLFGATGWPLTLWIGCSALLVLFVVFVTLYEVWVWANALRRWHAQRLNPPPAPAYPETYCASCGVPRSVYVQVGHDPECIWYEL